LMGVIREIGAFRRTRREAHDPETAAPVTSTLSR
jgi:hypothetical protein